MSEEKDMEVVEKKNPVDDLPARDRLAVLLTLIFVFLIIGFSLVIGLLLYFK